MKPTLIPHISYQNFVLDQLNTHYSGGILTLVRKDWTIISKLWITDLSFTTTWLHDLYSVKGPEPRDPASMLRSYLLCLLTSPTLSITEWVNQLHRVPLYTILSGFEPGDVPGVGTFYDFFRRLSGFEKANVKPFIKLKRKKKQKKKPKKGEKATPRNPGIIRKLVDRHLRHGSKQKQLPGDQLYAFFQSQFLEVSARLGLLGDPHSLGVVGDGTPVETASYPRSKPICDCSAQGLTNCTHPRRYSQPDIDSGWDSSRERYFNGYHLYMISTSDSRFDLPLYPRLHPASRHDSVSLVVSSIEFSQRYTLGTIDKILLDAAHDAEPIYELLDHHNVEPFIDLNVRTKKNFSTESDIQISPIGVPICPIGKEMKPNGFDISQNRQKWRCPLACGSKNTCSTPCSKAKYGRTFHTFKRDNLRLFTKTPRSSEKWKLIYKRRTSVERSNKREKVDYHLEAGRHRSTKMWYVRLYSIMMCQHIDAWYSSQKETLNIQEIIFTKSA
ncbi:transposase [Anaerobacillus isosaccharinicus]|uniref:Transposase n=2 Tax=Anaerobacillus isosaccharinicus TaxID=1532552 RepID=A0A7S7L5P9_9BACI|nr:transposase [Anaerobacillus isosaccharinicus]MBA5584515.1 transposase [Anaerobacillus isosaccharinicus]MBA5584721.1 transposase [Anaerobacillus isosaccharinicus]MBA5586918.1 transposase [Anaerobacillus isosaccharinicus]QOY34875.1 transposase [Anaerobacillus isosaccharinicus]QOY36909.1 transposase [Anaerobacillus isosaccharinicus]